jgi:type I restriction enzyme R subunit
VDDRQVMFCTKLGGKDSWFLPFNKRRNDGAGNPPNPSGMKTYFLWREALIDIFENYAQLVESKDDKTGKKRQSLIFPRYHRRDVVRKLLADARAQGPGKRYLIQHSASSGKSNSIAWFAHQLVGLQKSSTPIYDSVIVVTDRVLLDKQIRDTIKQFAQVGSIVGHAERSGQFREFLKSGKKIIITAVQKSPFVLADIGDQHRNSKFAILIDEVHSSQGGRTAAKMNIALSEAGADDDEDIEDEINGFMNARKLLSNASARLHEWTGWNSALL